MSHIDKINIKHKIALQWFADNAGKEVPWPKKLEDDILLFSKPKGIYKPKYSPYALSIRHVPNTQYKDEDPVFNPDGSWTYNYRQEEQKDSKPANLLFTNRALLACMRDEIPVGVALKKSEKPNVRYQILGLANVRSIQEGQVHLTSYVSKNEKQPIKNIDQLASLVLQDYDEPSFDPTSYIDGRDKTFRQIVQRRGQKRFRDDLLEIYKCTCVITGCKVKAVLEAAHITPYLGPHTNHSSNGLLLRADIHTLWDLGLIAINPESMKVQISNKLMGSDYAVHHGQKIKINLNHPLPSAKALAQQFKLLTSEEEYYG